MKQMMAEKIFNEDLSNDQAQAPQKEEKPDSFDSFDDENDDASEEAVLMDENPIEAKTDAPIKLEDVVVKMDPNDADDEEDDLQKVLDLQPKGTSHPEQVSQKSKALEDETNEEVKEEESSLFDSFDDEEHYQPDEMPLHEPTVNNCG